MNHVLQSGHHPDADQLSAFAEHALPPHEQQQTLAHVSVCADCRAIVYLAQVPELAAVAPPQPAAVRRPWFTGWSLALPAAFALAALVLVTVHLRKVDTQQPQAAADKTARVEPPAPPPQRPPSAAPTAPQAAQPKAAPDPLRAPVVKREAARPAYGAVPRIQPPMLPPRPPGTNAVGTQAGRSSPVFPRAAAGIYSTTTSADEAHQSMPGAVFKSTAQAAPASAAPASAAATQQAPLRSTDAARHELHSSATQYNAAAGTAQNSLDQAIPAAPSPPPVPPSYGAKETVTLTNAAPLIVTEDAASAQVIENQAYASLPLASSKLKKQPSLPSNLPTVSTVSNARHQLAIDSAGSLFRSQDAGVTWQPVSTQWTGRAVKLQLAMSEDARKLAGSAGATTPPAAKAAPPAPSRAAFKLTNDAGEVWTSTDGQTWKHE